MRTLSFAVVVLLAAACGGPGGFDGKVAGNDLPVKESLLFAIKDGNGKVLGNIITLANVSGACDRLKAGRGFKDVTAVLFALTEVSGLTFSGATPGDFTVRTAAAQGKVATATFTKLDAKCMSTIANGTGNGVSGLIKLGAIKAEAGGSAQGTFDITFGSQNDKATGSFNAVFCDANPLTATNCE